MDQSKKTMRHFYCRDLLWETFEQMANDFDCSIDYLLNEAMRAYARSKNYQLPSATASSQQLNQQVVNQAIAAVPQAAPHAQSARVNAPTVPAAARVSGPPPTPKLARPAMPVPHLNGSTPRPISRPISS